MSEETPETPGGGACAFRELPPCAPPTGWRSTGAAYVRGDVWVWPAPDTDQWVYGESGIGSGRAPTMLQAMCAALGLTVTRDNGGAHGWVCRDVTNEDGYFVVYVTREACCAAALEAFHARQQALKAQPGTPATAHPRPAGEVRGTGGILSGALEATGHPVTVERLLELAAIADAARALETLEPPRNMPLATMRPSWDSPPPIAPSSLSRLATEGLELAADARALALKAEGWAARVRAAGGGR